MTNKAQIREAVIRGLAKGGQTVEDVTSEVARLLWVLENAEKNWGSPTLLVSEDQLKEAMRQGCPGITNYIVDDSIKAIMPLMREAGRVHDNIVADRDAIIDRITDERANWKRAAEDAAKGHTSTAKERDEITKKYEQILKEKNWLANEFDKAGAERQIAVERKNEAVAEQVKLQRENEAYRYGGYTKEVADLRRENERLQFVMKTDLALTNINGLRARIKELQAENERLRQTYTYDEMVKTLQENEELQMQVRRLEGESVREENLYLKDVMGKIQGLANGAITRRYDR